MLMRMLFDEHPVPNDWLQRRPHQPAPSCGAQLDGIVCSASHRRPASRSRWSKTAPCRRWSSGVCRRIGRASRVG